QKLNFGGSSTSSKSSPKKDSGKTTGGSYTVKAGDTMGHIAHRLAASLAEVRKAAGSRSGDRIYVGQKLNFGGSSTPSKNSPK
ncbi:LysM peptidoglycan-binding domain-containing protein, partial [Escherichia coli]|nr:LysM peptidoglycan-binding domain-containing protein [Escherichia coli]